MTRLEQRLLLATGFVLLAGSGLYVALGGLSKPVTKPGSGADDSTNASSGPDGANAPRALDGDPIVPGTTAPSDDPGVLRPSGSGIPNGLREPSGEDLSDPKVVRELLRAQLAESDPKWDIVAKLLAVYREPLEADVKAALVASLAHGNAAGTLQALAALNDGTVVADILRLLDKPGADPRDRGNVLQALSTIPGANAAEVVTGIESRLTGDIVHDRVYLQAIARTGGIEAVRALVDAVSKSSMPLDIGADVFRELDFRKSPESADHLASVLRTTTLPEGALAVVVEIAGRQGATTALVESLLALDADTSAEPIRKRVLASLGATGGDAALERLMAVATKGADYASVAAKALGDVRSASPAMRAKILELATTTTDDNLRTQSVQALGELRSAPAVPMLIGYVSSPSPQLRTAAVIAISRIGKDAESAVDALAKAYDTGDEALRQHVAIALSKIGGDRAKALLRQFQSVEKSDKVKTTLGGALRQFGP